MQSILFLNFYSVGMLIVAAFTLVGMFMMFRVPGRPPAALHLGLAFGAMTLHNLSYAVGSAIYHPLGAYYRFGAALLSPAALIHMAMFFLYFLSDTKRSRPRSVLLIVLWAINLAATLRFAAALLERGLIYKFSGMTYDLDDTGFAGERALVLVFYVLVVLAAAIFRLTRAQPGRERRGVAAMLLAFLVASIAPVVANVLTRTGKIGQGIFQNVFTLVTIVGMFLIIIIFINTTRHRTTFVTKIVGVSVVTILTLLQYVAYYALQDRELAYDEFRRRDLQRLIDNPRAPIDGLVYLVERSSSEEKLIAGSVPAQLKREYALSGSRTDKLSGVIGGAPTRHVSIYVAPQGQHLSFEAAFEYQGLRNYLHPASARIALILLAVLAVSTLGFRIFFLGALVNPLERLIGGVASVNAGDLTAHVPVHVDDEIGYLTQSFNGMVTSIREARADLELYALELEAKVRERTSALSETLSNVETLKQQQDGDYFLTSLLLKPLGSSRASNSTVQVSSLVAQQKRFTFRKWEEEIGGDICIADSVVLGGESYTVFLNADAMGKSMQGAGGALVLGSVFRAILERSRVQDTLATVAPEQWLRSAFIELQKVFESFDGHMLVSAVIGLAQDSTGFLYMVNADHPRSVLLRSGKASFVEEVPTLNKFGSPQQELDFVVRTFAMQPNDCVVIGSDGRDDIRLPGRDGFSASHVNHDESLFLSAVEEARGDLEQIATVVGSRGTLIDDLSLISLFYDGPGPQRQPMDPEHEQRLERALALHAAGDSTAALMELSGGGPPAPGLPGALLREWIRISFANRDYAGAAHHAEQMIAMHPEEESLLHLQAVCHKRLGDLLRALELAERAVLRNPTNAAYLTSLIAILVKLGKAGRARSLAQLALDKHPDDERLRAWRERLKAM